MLLLLNVWSCWMDKTIVGSHVTGVLLIMRLIKYMVHIWNNICLHDNTIKLLQRLSLSPKGNDAEINIPLSESDCVGRANEMYKYSKAIVTTQFGPKTREVFIMPHSLSYKWFVHHCPLTRNHTFMTLCGMWNCSINKNLFFPSCSVDVWCIQCVIWRHYIMQIWLFGGAWSALRCIQENWYFHGACTSWRCKRSTHVLNLR